MSLQDNYFDVKASLEGTPEEKLFEEIWERFCDNEKELLEHREFITMLVQGITAVKFILELANNKE